MRSTPPLRQCLIHAAFEAVPEIQTVRDATRGGVGTVLYEIAEQSNVGIRLDAPRIPVEPEVRGVCGMLGLEPLYLACEGTMVMIVPEEKAEKVLSREMSCCRESAE